MDIVKEAELFAYKYFEDNIPSAFEYHSVEHTKLVVSVAKKIANSEGLDEFNMNVVIVAALFHDLGYSKSQCDHEEESCILARDFLTEKNQKNDFIKEVEKCILSTRAGTERNTMNETILGDADQAHTGLESFMEISNLYRKEVTNLGGHKLSKLDYWKTTLEFLKRIRFLTSYGKENFEENKEKNIKKVEKRIAKLEADKKSVSNLKTTKSTARGVETVFRLTARNQINLSSIADNKANIMLTINAALISVLISTNILNFQREIQFLVPVLILLVASLVSLIFSILSVRPNISTGKFTDEDLKNKNVNLLFFGNFYDMDYSKYDEGMKMMMDDYDFLYGNLIKDQYNLGKVLSRKYKLLSTAYNVFMVGFIAAVLTFFGFMIAGGGA